MRKSLLILPVLFFAIKGIAGDGEYAVSKIAPALLKNTHVVKRIDITTYEVISYTKVRYYQKYAVTILDEIGDKHAGVEVYYDNLRTFKSLDGKLFDAYGKEVKTVKNKDIKDYSATSGYSLMEDNRVKVHDFNWRSYPYTVEYEYTVEYNNTFIFPRWQPQYTHDISVERASMTVKCPDWYTFRYKAFNYEKEPDITFEKEIKSYAWSVNNLPSISREFAAPELSSLTTSVYFSPEKFEIKNYKGTMSSWSDFGKFQIELNKGRDILPEHVKQKVHSLTDGISDVRQKINVLYKYLQENTRYISIQLGIGGFQPFDAAYVAKNAYGDCKALSNYMYSLLKEANIKSHYTLIRAGYGEYFFIPDFAYDPFNHIILLVPAGKDTVWLECTSQTLPAGYLGSHTNNRYGLAINDEEGFLVHTPIYSVNENTTTRNVKAVLDNEATLNIKSSTVYKGMEQDNLHMMVNNLSKEKVKEILEEQLDFATYDINSFEYKENKTSLPTIDEKLDITVSNYATISGRRLFIMPNVMTKSHRKPIADEERKYDIILTYEYRDIDTIEITIPAGYGAESIPGDITVSSPFGKYSLSVKFADNKLTCYRSMEQYSGRFPPKEYKAMVKFYETIYKADRSKMVLVKNEEAKKGF